MNSDQDFDYILKVLLIGDAGVGKSSIMMRFTDDTFDDQMQSTIGVDFKVKSVQRRDKKVKVTIWDTAGQERFRTLTSSYYRGAHGIILCYDVTRGQTFDNLDQWLKEVQVYCPQEGKKIVKLLVGNKVDKAGREVSMEDGVNWARSHGMLFIEASAKTKVGIQQVFDELVSKIVDNPLLASSADANSRPRGLVGGLGEAETNETQSRGMCC
eukprot:INCI10899.1.p1 GENE.INCI10899.1~~INCI10899.1.p1  ORF type:complete len:212 (-),score=39.35 INCI10899.1:191-826(-)